MRVFFFLLSLTLLAASFASSVEGTAARSVKRGYVADGHSPTSPLSCDDPLLLNG